MTVLYNASNKCEVRIFKKHDKTCKETTHAKKLHRAIILITETKWIIDYYNK